MSNLVDAITLFEYSQNSKAIYKRLRNIRYLTKLKRLQS
jgi:hypothetical protein